MNIKPTKILFVGEERSKRAIEMGVRWEDGKLAAKQLFDALNHNKISLKRCQFVNWFEGNGKEKIKNFEGQIVAMGRRVEKELKKNGIDHKFIFHPASRGTIRKKENYYNHIREVLGYNARNILK